MRERNFITIFAHLKKTKKGFVFHVLLGFPSEVKGGFARM